LTGSDAGQLQIDFSPARFKPRHRVYSIGRVATPLNPFVSIATILTRGFESCGRSHTDSLSISNCFRCPRDLHRRTGSI
jgi:hypothetical protein